MEWDSIFKFSSFDVKHVKIPDEDHRPVSVQLERKRDAALLCHRCGSEMSQRRSFQRCQAEDLEILGRKVVLRFRRIKGKCTKCKKVRLEHVDFMSPQNPKMTARLAFLLFKFCEVAPVSRMAEIVSRPAMSLWRNDLLLLQHQLEHYEIPDVSEISVDEVYARAHHGEEENRSDRFFTVIVNVKTSRVIWVEESRRKEALDRFFRRIGPEKCALIEAVATDEHDDYISSMAEHCPNAVHVLDRFHVSRHLEEAVNDTRKMLIKMLPQKNLRKLAAGKHRYIFLKRDSSRTSEEKNHMAQVMKDNEAFTKLELIKERLLSIYDAADEEEGAQIFLEVEKWAKESGFPPIKKLCVKLRRKWQYIANYFLKRITTAKSEGINNVIKTLKRRAYGFKNMDYFKLKIMQVCGMLSTRYMSLNGQWTAEGLRLIKEGR